jgi:hypothetical protein
VSEAEGAEGQVDGLREREREGERERERERSETVSWLVRDREEWWKRNGAGLVILDKGQVTARYSAGGFSVSASIWIRTCICIYVHVHVHVHVCT